MSDVTVKYLRPVFCIPFRSFSLKVGCIRQIRQRVVIRSRSDDSPSHFVAYRNMCQWRSSTLSGTTTIRPLWAANEDAN